jgi:hypothetical protein
VTELSLWSLPRTTSLDLRERGFSEQRGWRYTKCIGKTDQNNNTDIRLAPLNAVEGHSADLRRFSKLILSHSALYTEVVNVGPDIPEESCGAGIDLHVTSLAEEKTKI